MHNIADILRNHSPISFPLRIWKTFESASMAALRPQDASYYSQLTDLTGVSALTYLHRMMLKDKDGAKILQLKPRITAQVEQKASKLPKGTLGYAYSEFMKGNNFKAIERPVVKYVPDIELAYVCQRYKEVHDFIHVLTGVNISVHQQLLVKWFEMIQLRLPSASMAALMSLILSPSIHLQELTAIDHQARSYKMLLCVPFEDHLDKPLSEFKEWLIINNKCPQN